METISDMMELKMEMEIVSDIVSKVFCHTVLILS